MFVSVCLSEKLICQLVLVNVYLKALAVQVGSDAYINLKLARVLLAHLDNVRHFVLAYSVQVLLSILVRMRCMGAHGSAIYSSERTYVHVSNVAGLRRSVLDSVGWYLLPLVADNGVCKVYASEKDVSKVWCSSACEEGGLLPKKDIILFQIYFPPMLSTTSVSDH